MALRFFIECFRFCEWPLPLREVSNFWGVFFYGSCISPPPRTLFFSSLSRGDLRSFVRFWCINIHFPISYFFSLLFFLLGGVPLLPLISLFLFLLRTEGTNEERCMVYRQTLAWGVGSRESWDERGSGVGTGDSLTTFSPSIPPFHYTISSLIGTRRERCACARGIPYLLTFLPFIYPSILPFFHSFLSVFR